MAVRFLYLYLRLDKAYFKAVGPKMLRVLILVPVLSAGAGRRVLIVETSRCTSSSLTGLLRARCLCRPFLDLSPGEFGRVVRTPYAGAYCYG